MNKDILEGKWKQIKGDIQKQWGKLTNDDLDIIDGNREKLSGMLQERYGKSKDEAEKEADEFLKKHGWPLKSIIVNTCKEAHLMVKLFLNSTFITRSAILLFTFALMLSGRNTTKSTSEDIEKADEKM